MTPLEQWLVNNLLDLAVVVAGGVWAYLRLNGRMGAVEKKIDSHLDAEADFPHPICRTESANLRFITSGLEEVKKNLDTLDDRIIDLIRNGSYHRSPGAPEPQKRKQ